MQGDRSNVFAHAKSAVVTGVVDRVVPVVDAKTRTFTVRVIINETTGLDPGMFARGQVTVARYRQIVTIPKDAVVEKNGKQSVYIIEHVAADSAKNAPAHDVARERQVTPGATDGIYLQILSGVTTGEQVITAGQQTLVDGDPINATTASSQ